MSEDNSYRTTEVATIVADSSGARMPKKVSDSLLEQKWSGIVKVGEQERNAFEYYDYYFTGEDIQIYIEGLELNDTHGKLPMMNFAYSISQQKAPIYGFWSYTYDEIMRGTRVVQGAFRIATKSTDYMTMAIAKAAEARDSGKNIEHKLRGNTQDEANIKQYWGKNLEYNKHIDQNIFSAHPPFNFVVVYGISDVSLCAQTNVDTTEFVSDYYNLPLVDTTNDRLFEVDHNENQMRRIIQNVEIMDMQVEYNPAGQVCSEVYTFIARDLYSSRTSKTPYDTGRVYVESESSSYSSNDDTDFNST
jgi:hypothetical protein